MKKLFEQIVSGSLRQLPVEVTAENAPEGDAEEHFKAIVRTFEIASTVNSVDAIAKKNDAGGESTFGNRVRWSEIMHSPL